MSNPVLCGSTTSEFCPALCYPPCNQQRVAFDAESEHLKITVFPNPSQNILTVSNTEKGQQILFYNLVGECVLKTVIEKTPFQIGVGELPDGIYFVKVDVGMSDKFTDVGSSDDACVGRDPTGT